MASFSLTYRRMLDARPSNLSSWAFFVLLWPWSRLFRLVSGARSALYRFGLLAAYRATVPVVSVGNLSVGGTGKTPVTDAVVRRFLAKGHRVAVVSRGYGGNCTEAVGCVARGDGRLLLTAQEAGDEPYLLAQRNPELLVYVARKRSLGVQAAERDGAQLIVLDDGFQHHAVQRDLDIVLLDARAPFGNGQVLPAGPLREPPTALKRAGLVIMTHAVPPHRRLSLSVPVLHCQHQLAGFLLTLSGVQVPWSEVQGREVVAFAGIARPDDFFAALRGRGVQPAATLAFGDHQDYSREELNLLIKSCDNKKLLITTEKDAVKLRTAVLPCPCLVAPLELEFDDGDELNRILNEVFKMSINHITKAPRTPREP